MAPKTKLSTHQTQGGRPFIAVLGFSLLLTGVILAPYLFDRYQFTRDLQNFYWLAWHQDITLFPTDYLYSLKTFDVTLFGQTIVLHPVSLGHSLLFYVISFFVDHIWFSKWIVFLLMPLCVWYLFQLGNYVSDTVCAVSLSLMFVFFILATRDSISLATGLQRSFAVPLLIIFVYQMTRERYWSASITIIGGALFYWPNFLLMITAYGLSFIRWETRGKPQLDIRLKKLVPVIFSGLVGILLLIPVFIYERGIFRSQEVAVTKNPEWLAEGPTPLFISFPWFGRAGVFDEGVDVFNFLVLLILGFFVYKVVGRPSFRRVPAPVWHLFTAAWALYFASFYTLVGLSSNILYQPSRYTRTALFVVILCFVGLNWHIFLKQVPGWFRRNRHLLFFFAGTLILAFGLVYILLPNTLLLGPLGAFFGLLVSGLITVIGASSWYWLHQNKDRAQGIYFYGLAMLIVIGVLITGGIYQNALGLEPISLSSAERQIIEFAAVQPTEALFVGDPVLMSAIPLFAKRSVLFRDLHPATHPQASTFILDYFDAQYAVNAWAILDFCAQYKVTHFILDDQVFDADYVQAQTFFYEPWNSVITERVRGRADFVLAQAVPIFSSPPYSIFECNTASLGLP
ncbi:MAG: hypothetical protein AAF629_25145 [Chloroflexota bacterium]